MTGRFKTGSSALAAEQTRNNSATIVKTQWFGSFNIKPEEMPPSNDEARSSRNLILMPHVIIFKRNRLKHCLAILKIKISAVAKCAKNTPSNGHKCLSPPELGVLIA